MTWPPLWGHYYWMLIHCTGIMYLPQNYSDPKAAYLSGTPQNIPREVIHALSILLEHLPCQVCVKHAATFVDAKPLESIVTSHDLIKYFFDMHNDVNRRLGKREISIASMFELLNYQLVHRGSNINDVYKHSFNSFRFDTFIPLIYSACLLPSNNTWFVQFLKCYVYLLPFQDKLIDSWVEPLQETSVSAIEAIELVSKTYNRHCGAMGHAPLDSAEMMKRFRNHFSDAETASTSRAYSMRLEDHKTLAAYMNSFQKIPRVSSTLEPLIIALLVAVVIFIAIATALLVATISKHKPKKAGLLPLNNKVLGEDSSLQS